LVPNRSLTETTTTNTYSSRQRLLPQSNRTTRDRPCWKRILDEYEKQKDQPPQEIAELLEDEDDIDNPMNDVFFGDLLERNQNEL